MRKKALITGASGGIGQAIAEEMAKLGYDVILHYNSDRDSVFSLMHRLEEKYGIYAHCLKCDLSKPEEVKEFAQRAMDFGKIEVLINNAGIAYQELFQLADEEKIRQLFEINLMSALSLTKEILPSMISEHYGRIINISSMWGIMGASCEVHYSVTKSALTGFTKSLAKEVGPSGITVNCIAPGFIDTKMNSHLSEEDTQDIIDSTPVMRKGTGEDVAHLAAFLASEKAGFITGQVIAVDGGYSA
ncbi:MAG: 3-oxoacyl-ACP reductase FabG [Acutalibacteraceae bacterium]|nr:3-oxoacyl-ACP reductase FabG [Acutalibacteraceae bacterium]